MTTLISGSTWSSTQRATLFGLLAILLWSTSGGLLRSIAGHFGPVGGAALIYSVSAICLSLARDLPKILDFPPRYLWIGGGCLSPTKSASRWRQALPTPAASRLSWG